MATVFHAPAPSTRHLSETAPTLSGSRTTADTVTAWLPCGVTGPWRTSPKVGPALATKRLLRAPGVPLLLGVSSAVVRATRLKYRLVRSRFEPPTQRAR